MNFDDLKPKITELVKESTATEDTLLNLCTLLKSEVSYYDWVGFYFKNGDKKELKLGPYAGAPTDHTIIPFGKGICGQVAVSNRNFVVPDVKVRGKRSAEVVKQFESEAFQKHFQAGDWVVLLDEKGKRYHSRGFAQQLQKWMNGGPKRLVFVVGGAFGFSPDLYERANAMLSMSEMTTSHQLIRVVFLEQLYRAFTILNNEPYHND